MTTVSLTDCPPRFGTPRNPDRPTLGPAVGEVARRLGRPFMPWQQHVADVALEIDPVTGRLAYTEVGLTVPRQSGKSTWILAKAVHRASATGFFGPRQKIVYTAQTRNKAREKWEEDYAGDVKASKTFGGKVLPHFGNGNEHLRFPNGSRFGIEANTEKAGHGGTLDEAYIDEAFAQPDGRLEQAFRPAMITRPNKQLVWVSTAGWEDGSPYLRDKVEIGRARAHLGAGLAYFEWSAANDEDPADPLTWRGCMPALGYTITEDAIRAELLSMKLPDFLRAYLNRWVAKPLEVEDEPVVSGEVWSTLADPASAVSGRVAVAAAVAEDRSWSCLAIAGLRSDRLLHVQLVDNRPGTAWLPDRAAQLGREFASAVTVRPSGPTGSLLPDLEAAGARLDLVKGGQYAQACGRIYDLATQSGLRHLGQGALDVAVVGARQRVSADAWVWNARSSKVDISPLEAVTLAGWRAVQERPSVYEERGMLVLG